MVRVLPWLLVLSCLATCIAQNVTASEQDTAASVKVLEVKMEKDMAKSLDDFKILQKELQKLHHKMKQSDDKLASTTNLNHSLVIPANSTNSSVLGITNTTASFMSDMLAQSSQQNSQRDHSVNSKLKPVNTNHSKFNQVHQNSSTHEKTHSQPEKSHHRHQHNSAIFGPRTNKKTETSLPASKTEHHSTHTHAPVQSAPERYEDPKSWTDSLYESMGWTSEPEEKDTQSFPDESGQASKSSIVSIMDEVLWKPIKGSLRF
eukprot:c3096_g1_i1.p1 GENE.c3096_g1_i1~~c3096_g1_i1.p1  ORF type:complete len:275 (+),score=56.71 c3096_g1_i1:43-825(+)